MTVKGLIRVLVVDDSALVRRVLSQGLAADPHIQVIGTASNPYEARDLLVRHRPDVITLDIEMPRMDGITFLRKYMAVIPTPTVVVSNLTTSESSVAIAALDAGAVDVLAKPRLVGSPEEATQELCARVKAAARVNTKLLRQAGGVSPATLSWGPHAHRALIAIGASTGGVAALGQILAALPDGAPPIVIGQHMPLHFTQSLAERLSSLGPLRVVEAEQGMLLEPGKVVIAAANDRHTEVYSSSGELRVSFADGPKDCFQRPAINVLFRSIAKNVHSPKIGVLLTGMGADGAEGLLQIRQAGGRTVCQDEASSVIYGMPQAAWKLGAAEQECALGEIPRRLTSWLEDNTVRSTEPNKRLHNNQSSLGVAGAIGGRR
jgi:two-component system, chemotaxis family, protein-glutamate methylesterase/glutaminase